MDRSRCQARKPGWQAQSIFRGIQINMQADVALDKMDWMEMKFSAYRKGCITVHVDFPRRLMSWRDSNRWFNDFVRVLTPDNLEDLRNHTRVFIETSATAMSIPGKPSEALSPCTAGSAPGEKNWCLSFGQEGAEQPLLEYFGENQEDRPLRELSRTVERVGQQRLAAGLV